MDRAFAFMAIFLAGTVAGSAFATSHWRGILKTELHASVEDSDANLKACHEKIDKLTSERNFWRRGYIAKYDELRAKEQSE